MGDFMHDKYSMIAFGQIINQRRRELGLSYNKLNKISQVDIKILKAIESGNQNVTLNTILKLFNILKLDIVNDNSFFK